MADTFGLSFAPLDNPQNPQQPQNGGGYGSGAVSPVQQAIQILSLRQPRVYGAGAPAAPQLLNAAGGGGVPDMQALLKALMLHLQGQMGMPDPNAGGGSPTGLSGPLGGGPSGNTLSNPLANVFGMPNAGVNIAPTTTAPPPKIDVRTDPEPKPYYPDPPPMEEQTMPAPSKPFYEGGMGNPDRGKGNRGNY